MITIIVISLIMGWEFVFSGKGKTYWLVQFHNSKLHNLKKNVSPQKCASKYFLNFLINNIKYLMLDFFMIPIYLEVKKSKRIHSISETMGMNPWVAEQTMFPAMFTMRTSQLN